MPSKSAKQRRFMAAAAHNPKFAKEAGIDQDVAKDFNRADQRADQTRNRKSAIKRAFKRVRG